MLTLLVTKTGIDVISLGTYCLMQFCAEVVLVRGMWISPLGESGKTAQNAVSFNTNILVQQGSNLIVHFMEKARHFAQ